MFIARTPNSTPFPTERSHAPTKWLVWVLKPLRIYDSRPRCIRRRRLRFLMILRPAVFFRFLSDDESLGTNHRTTLDGDQARRRIDVERDCALQFF